MGKRQPLVTLSYSVTWLKATASWAAQKFLNGLCRPSASTASSMCQEGAAPSLPTQEEQAQQAAP